jgi:hypothetical protein
MRKASDWKRSRISMLEVEAVDVGVVTRAALDEEHLVWLEQCYVSSVGCLAVARLTLDCTTDRSPRKQRFRKHVVPFRRPEYTTMRAASLLGVSALETCYSIVNSLHVREQSDRLRTEIVLLVNGI